MVRKIINEAHKIPFNNKYDLGDFVHSKVKEQTGTTLLRVISKLVSNDKITKRSLSLSQSIQHHITGKNNQTTLGLGIKLHHRYGSRDLLDLLHDHGILHHYDETRQFCKSAAKYVSENTHTLHQKQGFIYSVRNVYGWYDNFDLIVRSPNGRRETHAMATEFQMHPPGIVEGSIHSGISSLVIPHLTLNQAKSLDKNRAISITHYTGPKKVTIPAIPPKTIGVSYRAVRAQQMSLEVAQEKDVQWLNNLILGEGAME